MVEHEFSIIENTEAATQIMQVAVNEYNTRATNQRFHLYTMSWAEAWSQLMRVALYKKGPVISEIGATFTGDLVHMNSLRPFTGAEIQRAGGQEAFFPITLHNGMVQDLKEIWGLPLRLDVRLVWYWRDLVKQAGVDEATAFSTPECFYETMEKLQALGVPYPLHTFTSASRNTIYHLASWLWKRNGEFLDAEGKVAFHQPNAMEGVLDYFRLFRFIDPERPSYLDSFSQRKSAVVIQYPGALDEMLARQLITQEQAGYVGVAAMPGPSFVGGSNLVIWQHASYDAAQAASAFITGFLASDAYLDFARQTMFLPVLRAAARDPRWSQPHFQTMFDIVEQGRSHYGSYLWVVLVDRMAAMAQKTFNELFAPHSMNQAEITALIRSRVESLAARLENVIH